MGLLKCSARWASSMLVLCHLACFCQQISAQVSANISATAWPPVKFSQYEYIFVPRTEDWAGAQKVCSKSFNASLASVHSVEEHKFIMRTFIDTTDPTKFPIRVPDFYPTNDNVGHRGVWLGLRTDVSVSGSWVDKTPVDYKKWLDGKPDNYKGQEGCTQLYVDALPENWAGFWDDISCLAAMPFLCKRYVGFNKTYKPITFNGYDYVLHHERLKFAEADKTCQTDDRGRLVSVTSQDELQFLTSAFLGGQPSSDFAATMGAVYASGVSLSGYWIGLNRRVAGGNWSWVDGNTSTYAAWAEGAPDSFAGVTEDCAHMYAGEQPVLWFGQWNDVSCSTEMAFVCKRKSTGNGTSWLSSDTSPSSIIGSLADPLGLTGSSAPTEDKGVKRKPNKLKIALICGVVSSVVVIAALSCLLCKWKRRANAHQSEKVDKQRQRQRRQEQMDAVDAEAVNLAPTHSHHPHHHPYPHPHMPHAQQPYPYPPPQQGAQPMYTVNPLVQPPANKPYMGREISPEPVRYAHPPPPQPQPQPPHRQLPPPYPTARR